MKKVIVALAAVALVTGSYADISASMSVYFGVLGNGAEGGIVDDVIGTKVVATVINTGADGRLELIGGNGISYTDGVFDLMGDDSLIGAMSLEIDEVGAFQNEGFGLIGIVGGQGVANTDNAVVVVSGILDGDWAWIGTMADQGVDAITGDGDFDYLVNKVFGGDTPPTPQNAPFGFAGSTADGSVTVIPEPATLGLMGVAGLGMFLARKKSRA